MSEMLERVAAALANFEISDRRTASSPSKWADMAKVAIAEMREPTQAMLDAVCSDDPYALITAHDAPVRETWREMIDVALQ